MRFLGFVAVVRQLNHPWSAVHHPVPVASEFGWVGFASL
jgi:hypothetical protein